MNHPPFSIFPTSMSGHSLLQWTEPGERLPRSIQVPTATARFIVESVQQAQRVPELEREIQMLRELARRGRI